MVIRRYVESLPNVKVRSGFFVRKLITAKAPTGLPPSAAVEGRNGTAHQNPLTQTDCRCLWQGLLHIETAEGRRRELREESEQAGILYFTRHYRLLPGCAEPDRKSNPPASGDLGYRSLGVFPGDNGNFSITIALPEIEMELRKTSSTRIYSTALH
jgi:hypothetical protein